ncbi:class I SAM-dependent methyltransferase [Paenibacillus filicis]|uniref:Class I SAM-dependent methyltransferase n=1 Tax=Paenibacillus gyeongsangnamensis TaxID=3388067 RepID=A0ABT4Q9N7_9BACL|nr:class I SAM-dependent methyltransferase [Paenibacillus filicis]MCZ8513597.1 class I SAM-dependent methyltransferase [Paenibacillus filicis]
MIVETKQNNFIPAVQGLVNKKAYSLLDIGCGVCSLLGSFDCPVLVGLDVHRPYLENRVHPSERIIPIHADALTIDRLFLPKTFSMILLNDVIEHFNKQDGLRLLAMAETIAVKRIIVFTPSGFFPQSGYDYYNLQGEVYQEHRSGWEPDEFERMGYKVLVFKGLHDSSNPSFVRTFGKDHPPVDALLAWKDL